MKLSKGTREVSVKPFMSRPVQSVSPSLTVEKAIKRMAEKNVGSLVVTNGTGPTGILSERDLLSKLVALGKEPSTTKVKEVMTGRVVRLGPQESLREAARTMNSKTNRILVFEKDKLAGILTATDIVRALHELGIMFQIDQTITKKVYTLNENAPLEQAVQLMSQLWVGSVITLDEEDEPSGIFTERDLVKKVLAPGIDMKQAVGKVASKPLITADDDIEGNAAADIMAINHIKRLPLTNAGVVVGIVTARDLVEAFGNS